MFSWIAAKTLTTCPNFTCSYFRVSDLCMTHYVSGMSQIESCPLFPLSFTFPDKSGWAGLKWRGGMNLLVLSGLA